MSVVAQPGNFEDRIAALESKCKKLQTSLKRKRDGERTEKKDKKYRPLNAYMFWCNKYDGGMRVKIKEQLAKETDGPPSMKEVAKKLGERWKSLPEIGVKADILRQCSEYNELKIAEYERARSIESADTGPDQAD